MTAASWKRYLKWHGDLRYETSDTFHDILCYYAIIVGLCCGKRWGTGAEQDQVSNGQQETETLLTMDITDEPTLGQTEEMEIGVFDFEKRSVLLNSGYEMPIMGLGTYSLDYDTCVSSVKALLVSGGRLIDTAYMYHNEDVYCKG